MWASVACLWLLFFGTLLTQISAAPDLLFADSTTASSMGAFGEWKMNVASGAMLRLYADVQSLAAHAGREEPIPSVTLQGTRQPARQEQQLTAASLMHEQHLVLFDPNGHRLVSTSGPTITVWEANGGRRLRVLSGHIQPVVALVFSPDGRWLAVDSFQRKLNVLVADGKMSAALARELWKAHRAVAEEGRK